MPAIALAAPVRREIEPLQWKARQNRDPAVPFHALENDVVVARTGRGIAGEQVVRDLGFLQAKDVRVERLDQMVQQAKPQPERIDVPGRDPQ